MRFLKKFLKQEGVACAFFDIASIKSPIKEILSKISAKGMKVTSIHPMFGPDTDLLTGKHVVFMNLDDHGTHLEIMKLFESTTAQLIEMSIDSLSFIIICLGFISYY